MPMQVPAGLDRGPAPEAAPAGQIATNVADSTGADKQIGAAEQGVGEQLIKYQNGLEKSAAYSEGQKQSNALEQYMNKALYGYTDATGQGVRGVSQQDGDPTQLYAQYDSDMQSKVQELQKGQGDGYSPMTQAVVNKMLARTYNRVYDKRITLFGSQLSNYQDQMASTAITLQKKDMMDQTGNIDPDQTDESTGANPTLQGFQNSIDNMRDTVALHAIQTHGGVVSDTGKYIVPDPVTGQLLHVDLGPQAEQNLAKNLSDGVSQSIQNLIVSNKLDSAKLLMDQYGKFMDPVNTKKVNEDYEKANTEAQAYDAVQENEDKPFKVQMANLNTIDDEKVKQKALELLSSNERYKSQMQEEQSTTNSNMLINYVNQKQNSDSPFLDRTSLEADGMFKRLAPNISNAKQMEAVYNIVDKPKDSDPEVKNEMFNMIKDNTLGGLDAQGFTQKASGLNAEDTRLMQNQWIAAVKDTEGQQRARLAYVTKNIHDSAIAKGLVELDQFGKPTQEGLETINGLQSAVTQELANVPKGTSQADLDKYTKSVISDALVKKAKENSSVLPDWISNRLPDWMKSSTTPVEKPEPEVPSFGATKKSAPAPSGPETQVPLPSKKAAPPSGDNAKALGNPTSQQMDQMLSDFKKANGRPPKSSSELLQWGKDHSK